MSNNGNIGHSEILSFMSDGYGDFRPIFKVDKEIATPELQKEINKICESKRKRKRYTI